VTDPIKFFHKFRITDLC